MKQILRIAAVCCIAASSVQAVTTRTLASLPPVVITGVTADNSSVKIDYQPVPGAQDYRVYDVSTPTTVKYAGLTHLDAGYGSHFVLQADGVTPVFPYTATANWKGGSGPQTLTVPGTEIQWNRLDDGQPHTLVVQAVDALGPVPPANLTDVNNNPLTTPLPGLPMPLLGANEGPTPDGNISINGQGPSTNTPHVIAQSAPFVVQANRSLVALPSRSDAVQSFFDPFNSAEGATLQQVGTTNAASGTMTYTLNAGTSRAWTISYQGADTDHSYPMVEDGHFMDVLFDGETPSAIPSNWCTKYGLCPHMQYSSLSLSPQPTADLAGGKLLHLTMEVDSHLADTHRWLAWQLAPATDPLTNFRADDYVTGGFQPTANSRAVNQSNQALWIQLFPNNCDALLFHGSRSATNPVPLTTTVIAQMSASPSSYPACHRTVHWGDAGAALDDRDRWDVFLTTTHLALFEDGQLVEQADIPGGLPFSQAKLYFTHYVYATANQFEAPYLQANAPWETYWLNNFPHSDERHWDNMGFEVLPAADVPADWHALSTLIHLPAAIAPTFTSDPLMPMMTPTPMPPMNPTTATPVPPTATNTVVPPSSTPTATRTATPLPSTATRTATPPSPTPSATATPTRTTAARVSTSTTAPSTHTTIRTMATATPTAHAPRRHVPAITPLQHRVRAPSTARSPLKIGGVAIYPAAPRPGRTALLRARVTARSTGAAYTITFRVRNARGRVVWQTRHGPLAFRAGRARLVTALWRVPRTLARGHYSLDVQAQKVSPPRHTAPRRTHHTAA